MPKAIFLAVTYFTASAHTSCGVSGTTVPYLPWTLQEGKKDVDKWLPHRKLLVVASSRCRRRTMCFLLLHFGAELCVCPKSSFEDLRSSRRTPPIPAFSFFNVSTVDGPMVFSSRQSVALPDKTCPIREHHLHPCCLTKKVRP